MAASPATTAKRQSSTAEHRPDTAAKTASTTATRLSANATDDEILGLTTNIRRKDLTGSQGRTRADVDLGPVAFASLERCRKLRKVPVLHSRRAPAHG